MKAGDYLYLVCEVHGAPPEQLAEVVKRRVVRLEKGVAQFDRAFPGTTTVHCHLNQIGHALFTSADDALADYIRIQERNLLQARRALQTYEERRQWAAGQQRKERA